MKLHESLAAVVSDWASHERRTEPERMATAAEHYPHLIRPCQACCKRMVVSDGICPDCLDVISGACLMAARRFTK